MIRTAIIGYGLAGATFHAPLINSVDGMTVSGIVTSNAERQKQASTDFPDAKILKSADEIWTDKNSFDLVVVATTNETHAPLATRAMEAGLAVVIDKPMTVSSADAEQLIDTSKRTGALLSVFQNRRWDNDFLTVQDLIRTNRLSTITRFESRYERYRAQPKPGGWRESTSAEKGGGLLFDLGSHLIDQALVLFGEPTSIYAEVKTRRHGILSDDDTFLALQFASGAVAHLWVSLVSKIQGPRMRLLGLAGAYEKWGLDPQENQLKDGIRPGHSNWGREPDENWGRLSVESSDENFDGRLETKAGSYETYYSLMRDAIVSAAPVPVPPEDALRSLKIIERARTEALQAISA